MTIVINIILWVWSHFPVFALSDDANFATLEMKDRNKIHLRFSLLNFMLGDTILYFISVDVKERKFELMHKINLRDMQGVLLTKERISEIQESYKDHLNSVNQSDWDIEKESLCYRIQIEEQRISSSIEKINIYATIILTVIPLLLAIIDFRKIITLSIPLAINIVFILYTLINICIYVFRAIKVRGIYRSTFKDLRESENRGKEILVQYQYDWQQLKYEAQLFVNFVLNLQEWVIAILILSVSFSIGVSLSNENKDNRKVMVGYDSVYMMNLKEIEEPYSNSSIIWAEIILDIEQKKCDKIFFLSKEESKCIDFIKKLDKYKNLEIKVIKDETLEENTIKIIREEENEKTYFK